MSEKPLCGHCYNECTDNCCDKRKIDVLERQLKKAHEEIDRLNDEIETMKEYEKIVDGVEGGGIMDKTLNLIQGKIDHIKIFEPILESITLKELQVILEQIKESIENETK